MRRRVRQTGKDEHGTVTKLGNPGQSWSPRNLAEVIADIENGTHAYYVDVQSPPVDVQVLKGPDGKYLQSTSNPISRNNLSNLPKC